MQNLYKMLFLILLSMLLGFLTTSCDNQQQSSSPASIPEVSTVAVKTEKVSLSTELPGRTSAYRIAEIRPQVSGLLLKRMFKEGADVKAGQMLYQIDPAPFQAVVDNAKANLTVMQKTADQARAALKASIADVERLKVTLELAQTNRKRYETSFKEKVVSTIQRDQAVTEAKVSESALWAAKAQVESRRGAVAAAEAAIQQAKAALKTVTIDLGYTKVKAPISGRIGRSNVTEGAILTAYQAMSMATIQQLDPIYVDVPQSTTQLLRLKRRIKEGHLAQNGASQQQVRLILEDDTPYTYNGKLQFSDVTVDPTTGSVILRVVFPNPDNLLLPGMFVHTLIKEGVKQQAILIPQQGVSRDHKGNPTALIVDLGNKVGLRMLTIDRAIGNRWLVSSGLEPGDMVIVEGLLMLRPGTTVRTVPFSDPDAGPVAGAETGVRSSVTEDGGA